MKPGYTYFTSFAVLTSMSEFCAKLEENGDRFILMKTINKASKNAEEKSPVFYVDEVDIDL